MGELYYDNPITDTLAFTLNTPAKISPATNHLNNGGGFSSPNNGELRYTGTPTRTAQVQVAISGKLAAGTNCNIQFDIYKNGSKVTGSGTVATFASSTVYNSHCFQKLVSVSTNDILTVYATNLTDSNDLQIYGFNLSGLVVA
jgi:hypothetical protein